MSSILMVKAFNKLFSLKPFYCYSKQRISYLLTKLNDRKVIAIQGKDSYDYIQGLVTNDMRHLCPTLETSVTHDCIYSFVLNTSGRVITDVFIYRQEFSDTSKQLMIELDSKLLHSMTKYFNSLKIRRKIQIDVKNGSEVWVVFPSVDQLNEESIRQLSESETTFETLRTEDMIVVRDPRLKEIGFRLVIDNKNNSNENIIKEKIKTILNSKSIEFCESSVQLYDKYRYRLGVGEGIKDFPIETCFPLECNGDFLHAISFQKGCYVGQELTARVYHTGVVRKRLMPIEMIGFNDNQNPEIQNILTNTDKTVGKLRSNSGAYGLALLRVEECLKAEKLVLSESRLSVNCFKPFWWPKEVKKESLATGKGQ